MGAAALAEAIVACWDDDGGMVLGYLLGVDGTVTDRFVVDNRLCGSINNQTLRLPYEAGSDCFVYSDSPYSVMT